MVPDATDKQQAAYWYICVAFRIDFCECALCTHPRRGDMVAERPVECVFAIYVQ